MTPIRKVTLWVVVAMIIAIAIAYRPEGYPSGPTSDTSPSAATFATDSPETTRAELHDMRAAISLLNSSVDVGNAFEEPQLDTTHNDNDTLVVRMDTDKISTGQDQRRVLNVLLEAWVKAYKDYHNGIVDEKLYVAINDLSGQQVQFDLYDPTSQ